MISSLGGLEALFEYLGPDSFSLLAGDVELASHLLKRRLWLDKVDQVGYPGGYVRVGPE